MNNESNILFEIYDINNILINTIKTDINGKAIITLPYGTYTIKQINTTEGYNKSNDITINIKDTEKETINIYDYKIKVPNTKIKDNKNIFIIIITILYIIYVKKEYIINIFIILIYIVICISIYQNNNIISIKNNYINKISNGNIKKIL